MAKKAVDAATDKQASDIVLLDVRQTCSFADYFIICSGESDRQLRAIYEEIERVLDKEGVHFIRREGTFGSGWVVLDFGDIVIHIFSPAERDYYNLEELWSNAIQVLRIQ